MYKNKDDYFILKNILYSLSDLSKQIGIVDDAIDKIGISKFNNFEEYPKYIEYCKTGKDYHNRCLGYMEAIVLCKNYNSEAICYWTKNLFKPSTVYLNRSINYLYSIINKIPYEQKDTYDKLERETKVLECIIDALTNTCNELPASCITKNESSYYIT